MEPANRRAPRMLLKIQPGCIRNYFALAKEGLSWLFLFAYMLKNCYINVSNIGVMERMIMSRFQFVSLFLMGAFIFLFATNDLLDEPHEAFFGSETEIAWKKVLSIVLSPVKIILVGPLLPFLRFLHQDPDTPPPFFILGFAIYWTLLALVIYSLTNRKKHAG